MPQKKLYGGRYYPRKCIEYQVVFLEQVLIPNSLYKGQKLIKLVTAKIQEITKNTTAQALPAMLL